MLLLQKNTKSKPQYEPKHYTVTEAIGTQITAKQGDKIRIRDTQKFKKTQIS